jgi:hypothetical protein
VADRIPRIYVAGPYSARARAERIRNAWNAGALAAHVAELGAYPVVPHLVGMHVAEHCAIEKPYQWWIDVTKAELLTCDAVMLVPGWGRSKGTLGEIELAKSRDMPVFEFLEQLKEWLAPVLRCKTCGAEFDSADGERHCPKPSPGREYVDTGRGNHIFVPSPRRLRERGIPVDG